VAGAGTASQLPVVLFVATLLQLVGAGCLTVVVLTHICEAFDLVPWMQWGLPNSVGHYLDLASAVLGLVLFPIGYLWRAITAREP
jgi:hypothetical protein